MYTEASRQLNEMRGQPQDKSGPVKQKTRRLAKSEREILYKMAAGNGD
jgi:hypothetical protein